MRKLALLVTVVCCFGSTALQGAPPQIDPAKEADIRRLMELTGAAKLGQTVGDRMLEQLRPAILHSLPPGERSEQIADAFATKFKARVNSESLGKLIIPIYDKYLTREDLEGLIQFYQTPLGRKMIRVLPQISQESYQAGAQWGEQIAKEVADEMAKEYPELKTPQ